MTKPAGILRETTRRAMNPRRRGESPRVGHLGRHWADALTRLGPTQAR